MIKLSSGIYIDTDLFNYDFQLRKIELLEVLGGELPKGSIQLTTGGTNDPLRYFTEINKFNLIIKIDDPNRSPVSFMEYDLSCMIVDRSFLDNYVTFSFIVAPDHDFFIKRRINSWDNIIELVSNGAKGLWKGKSDVRSTSTIKHQNPIPQCNETDHSFLSRISLCYRKNSIFGFGLNGYIVKDIVGGPDRLKPDKVEPHWALNDLGSVSITSDYNLHYVPLRYQKPSDRSEELDFAGEESYYSTSTRLGGRLLTHSPDVKDLMENLIQNSLFYQDDLYSDLEVMHTHTLPFYALGDTILFDRGRDKIRYPFRTYCVWSNAFSIATDREDKSPHRIEVRTLLRGIDEDGKILPTEKTL